MLKHGRDMIIFLFQPLLTRMDFWQFGDFFQSQKHPYHHKNSFISNLGYNQHFLTISVKSVQ